MVCFLFAVPPDLFYYDMEGEDSMETTNLSYNKKAGIAYIDTTKDKIFPGYARYLLESIGINPFTISLVFADDEDIAYRINRRGDGEYEWQEV